MPIAPRPMCTERYCPNKANAKSTRCDSCYLAKQREYDGRRRKSSARGNTGAWQAFRKQYLIEHPRCECTPCMLQPYWARPIATDIDHIDGSGREGKRAYDVTNLRAMSHSHHSKRTAVDQPGGWNKRNTA